MQTLLTLAIGALFGALTAHYAKQRGKDPYLWFFIGLFLGLIGFIFLFLFPAKQRDKQEETNAQPKIEPNVLPPAKPVQRASFWYFLDKENNQFGPMSFEGLQMAWKEGKVTLQTYIWNDEMENWKLYGEVFADEKAPS